MKGPLIFGMFLNFLGACYFTGEVVRGDIFNPTPHENEAALVACIFLLGLAMGFGAYEKIVKPIKKTDSQ